MGVIKYKKGIQISTHFNSSEFRCPHCDEIIISTELISKLEKVISKINASKCVISSGYRCSYYDKKENGFAGKHSEGLACDCIFYDNDNNIIPSKIICCVAVELGFNGIAYINEKYSHLDVRNSGIYRGDEVRGNSNYWSNPYSYFNIDKNDINKYVNFNTNITYQVYGKKWYSNVISGTSEYAGIFGISISRVKIDKLKYKVRSNGKWLPEVLGRNDFAGYSNGIPITDIAIQNATYRVHICNGKWLNWVTGYDINDKVNGYAGNGQIIDALQIK